MRSPLTFAVVLTAVVVVAGAALAVPLRSGGRLTTVPPAFYSGTSRAETVSGTKANDVLLGRGGNDVLYGRGGNDVLRGGTGNDRLYGGPGKDVLAGEVGNDRLYARDGVRETVTGGPGFDEAWLDRLDVARNVERVHRS
jgi:RTX calcium-binding nonapeptide repeat (4 copies)